MTHAPTDGYSTSELADKIAKLGVNFSDLDSDNDPDDEYILDQYLFFVFVQDIAKDVYDDPKASDDAKQLAKSSSRHIKSDGNAGCTFQGRRL